jgi:hypothetical protein
MVVHGASNRFCGNFYNVSNPYSSDFGGLVVSMLASGTQVRGLNPAEAFGTFGAKKSSAFFPMSQIYDMLKNPTITVEVAILG